MTKRPRCYIYMQISTAYLKRYFFHIFFSFTLEKSGVLKLDYNDMFQKALVKYIIIVIIYNNYIY